LGEGMVIQSVSIGVDERGLFSYNIR